MILLNKGPTFSLTKLFALLLCKYQNSSWIYVKKKRHSLNTLEFSEWICLLS